MENHALIFIPDISGFTKFITHCKLKHSRRILLTLIKIILASNRIGLKLSEIEGDAVLFYIKGEIPDPATLIQQAENTYSAFHDSLRAMETELFCGCDCGSCTTASDLTLKFIVHYGPCEEMPVNGFMKLIGSGVILAHRLLKTDVPDREYILFSQDYLNFIGSEKMPEERRSRYHSHRQEIEGFGKVQLGVVSLVPFREAMGQGVPQILLPPAQFAGVLRKRA